MAPALPMGLAAMAASAAASQQQQRALAPSHEAATGSDRCLPSSPRDGIDGSPLHEVTLAHLHKRSSPLRVTCSDLAQGLDSARRLDALEWLVQAFDALNLSDAQLFSAFSLLDRFAAASPQPISAGPGAFAYVLAAMLVALKVSGTQRDLERAKRLVIEASGTPRPWAAVRKAELQILRRLGFRACTPTCLDFLERLLTEAFASSSSEGLEPEARTKCGELARCLLELGVVHEPEAVYGSSGHAPLASALAAALLALLAFRAPTACMEAFREPLSLLETGDSVVVDLAEAMRTRWQAEERKSASTAAGNSAVLEKWKRRMGSIGATVPSSLDMRHIMPEGLKGGEDTELSGLGRRLRGKQSAVSPLRPRDGSSQPTTSLLLAPPTAITRASTGGERASTAVEQGQQAASKTTSQARHEVLEPPLLVAPGSSELPPSSAVPSSARNPPATSGGESVQRSSSARESSGCQHGPAVTSAKYPPSQLVSALSRVTASENLSTWPLTGSSREKDAPLSPQIKSGAEKGVVAEKSSPEPLVELPHVLNMLNSTSNRLNAARSGNNCEKTKPPSVASELLVSSALRLAWPPDRRKGVDVTVAAVSCRDAAAALEEAAQYLRNTAANLDTGILQTRETKVPTVSGAGSESKRRRTFGGPSPPRGSSPTATAAPAPAAPVATARVSPPVVRGIRV